MSTDPLNDVVEDIRRRNSAVGEDASPEIQLGRLRKSQEDVGTLLNALDAVRSEMRDFAHCADQCYENGDDCDGSVFQSAYQRLERALDSAMLPHQPAQDENPLEDR